VYASALMAFLHHLAAFTAVGALAIEIAVFKPPLTTARARYLQRVDLVFGIAAGVVLIVGLLRVWFFEKGADYYWHNIFFLLKFTAFVLAALVSIYPTVTFLSWSRGLSAGVAPEVAPERARRVRGCLMLELSAIVVILGCAALMARVIGYLR
jgi:putative membrane protein